jgi:hypothetical protein
MESESKGIKRAERKGKDKKKECGLKKEAEVAV